MSRKKTFLGILLLFVTFSSIFLINIIPTFLSNKGSRFEKEIKLDLDFLKDEKKPIVLIFFGYVGCTQICAPSLKKIDEIYNRVDKTKVSVYFVNLLSSVSFNSVDSYTKIFNKDFNGVYLKEEEVRKIIYKLNVIYSPSILDSSVIDHSGFLHLAINKNKEYFQKYVYTSSPFDVDFIVNDINNIIKKGEF